MSRVEWNLESNDWGCFVFFARGEFMANSVTHKTNGHAFNNGTHSLTAGFSVFAQRTASWTGHPIAFLLAAVVVVVWIVTGPIFDYSDTWQLVINTGTTIITFLMVFLIQNTQNRDMLTMQLKLSELVLALKGAENRFAAIEDLSDEELEELHNECRARAEQTLDHLEGRRGKNRNPAAGGKAHQ
jgi:low affinity Fe/Cu permease